MCVAVRASSAIPFLFQPVRIGGRLYVDGGCLRNLPFDAFPPPEHADAAGGSSRWLPRSENTLALSVRAFGPRGVRVMPRIASFADFAAQLADTMLFGPDSANSLAAAGAGRRALGGRAAARRVTVLHIDAGDVGTAEFSISRARKAFLVARGHDAVRRRLEPDGPALEVAPAWLSELAERAAEEDAAERAAARTRRGADAEPRELLFSPRRGGVVLSGFGGRGPHAHATRVLAFAGVCAAVHRCGLRLSGGIRKAAAAPASE